MWTRATSHVHARLFLFGTPCFSLILFFERVLFTNLIGCIRDPTPRLIVVLCTNQCLRARIEVQL
jgi:hypothetical protein